MAMFRWEETEPDSGQKLACLSRQGRSAIQGYSGGTGQPAAALLHEGETPCLPLVVRAVVGLEVTMFHFMTTFHTAHLAPSPNLSIVLWRSKFQ